MLYVSLSQLLSGESTGNVPAKFYMGQVRNRHWKPSGFLNFTYRLDNVYVAPSVDLPVPPKTSMWDVDSPESMWEADSTESTWEADSPERIQLDIIKCSLLVAQLTICATRAVVYVVESPLKHFEKIMIRVVDDGSGGARILQRPWPPQAAFVHYSTIAVVFATVNKGNWAHAPSSRLGCLGPVSAAGWR